MSHSPEPPTFPARACQLLRQPFQSSCFQAVSSQALQLRARISNRIPTLCSRVRTSAGKLHQTPCSLQQQLGLMLICMSLAFMGGIYLLQTNIVMPTFVSLERQRATRDVNRCLSGLERELEMLGDLSSDWGAWDDSYRYVEDRNADFQTSNLTKESFASARISMLAILNAKRELVWGECYDPKTQEKIELPALWPMLMNKAFSLIPANEPDTSKGGLVLTQAGPMLIACNPIITSKREGPVRGTMVMGRFLDQSAIEDLGNRAEVNLTSWLLTGPNLPPEHAGILEELRDTGELVIRDANPESLLAYAKVDDVNGIPLLLFRVEVPKEVIAQGHFAGMLATWGGILGSILIMTGAALLIRRRVVQPLEQIVTHARRIGEKSDLKARLNSPRTDEIGQLSKAFDQMVECLSASRKKVLEAAHQAGMADVASEVLHNVGNVINSAKTSVEQLEAQGKSSNLQGLKMGVDLLNQNSERAAEFFTQDPRGPKLIAFLVKVASALEEESQEKQEILARIGKSIHHIQEIISMQEYRAHRSSFTNETDVEETLREVIFMCHDRFERSGIEVRLITDPLPEMMLNRGKLIQVLLNLIRNSIQAMESPSGGNKLLTLTARRIPSGGVEIEVRDSGCGLTDEVKANLFRNGFTTKAEGHGIGLHYCANAVRTMGGQILAVSDGPGRGTSVLVRLPETSPGGKTVLETARAA